MILSRACVTCSYPFSWCGRRLSLHSGGASECAALSSASRFVVPENKKKKRKEEKKGGGGEGGQGGKGGGETRYQSIAYRAHTEQIQLWSRSSLCVHHSVNLKSLWTDNGTVHWCVWEGGGGGRGELTFVMRSDFYLLPPPLLPTPPPPTHTHTSRRVHTDKYWKGDMTEL